MSILGLNGKPLVIGGKVIVPPTVGGTVNVSYNTVEPNRYSVNLNNNTAQLDLTGLVTGSHYICNIHFQGQALDSYNTEIGDVNSEYNITVFSTGSEQNDYIVYSSPDFLAEGAIIYNSNQVLNLDLFLESTKNDYNCGMAYYITEMIDSVIVSWD